MSLEVLDNLYTFDNIIQWKLSMGYAKVIVLPISGDLWLMNLSGIITFPWMKLQATPPLSFSKCLNANLYILSPSRVYVL